MQLLQLNFDFAPHFFECSTDVMLIEIIRRLSEFAGCVMMLGADHAILHVAVAGHHNEQHAFVRQA